MVHDEKKFKVKDIVEFVCDKCGETGKTTLKIVRNKRKKFGMDLCNKCSLSRGASIRPQNKQEYWSEKAKSDLGTSIKESKKYKEGILNRKMTGENNSMFGKKHKDSTKEKMSISRTGKIQSKETIEKRVRKIKEINRSKLIEKNFIDVNKQIRGYLHSEIDWYGRIYERDNYKCQKCNSGGRLDAHHIIPLSKIIKELTENKNFETELEKYNYLITEPSILDKDLKNGIALCRKCHREIHKNWGSHNQ
jgi:5-methylcytosine-specific restriction endonuclease McrA